MILFVDYEHEERYAKGDVDWLLAARTRITYRLEDLSGRHCMLVRYDRVTPELIDRLGVEAIFVSGQGTDPSRYRADQTAALASIVTESGLPVFGFCGGWQFIATSFGAPLVPIEVPPERADDAIIKDWGRGRLSEFGYHPVDLVSGSAATHPLLDRVARPAVFRHAHGLHIPELPDGFQTLASTPVTPTQLAVDDKRRMVGTQFHPEYWTEEHPAGRQLIVNFLHWAGLGTSSNS